MHMRNDRSTAGDSSRSQAKSRGQSASGWTGELDLTTGSSGALAGLRVLDMSGPLGNYATKLFADLGADVLLIEPLDGNPTRDEPPFGAGMARERSLTFAYQNTNKRSVCIDFEAPLGREILLRLAGTADLLVEDRPPGDLARLGLAPDELIRRNERLTVTSITPFGQTGPYADHAHSDIVCLALGGLLWMGGYDDGPPVMAAGNQAYMAGNLFGAVASMVAITHAELTGQGQWVDVSVQESVTLALENAAQTWDLERTIRRRYGGTQRQAGFGLFPCADGDVFLLAGGIGGNRFWPNLVDWMQADGVPDVAELRDEQWGDPAFLSQQSTMDRFWEIFVGFASDKNMQDLYHESQRWRVPLCPINRPSDVLVSRQLIERQFFVDAPLPGDPGSSCLMPGAPYRLSETPWSLRSVAPALGQHTAEILEEIGVGRTEFERLRAVGVLR